MKTALALLLDWWRFARDLWRALALALLLLLVAAQAAAAPQSFLIGYRWWTPQTAAAELPGLAARYQFFVTGSTDQYRADLRALIGDKPMVRYLNITNVDAQGDTPEWRSLCRYFGADIEQAFLHAAQPFVFQGQAYPAGARLPCFWQNRFVLNVANPKVQAWASVVAQEMAALGPGYDGLMVDNGWWRLAWSDWGYPATTGTQEGVTDADWLQGLCACLQAARSAVGGQVVVNTGNYIQPATDALVASCDGYLGEWWIRPSREVTAAQILLTRERDRAGKVGLLHNRCEPVAGDADRGRILGLALYYLMAGERTYLFCGENYGAAPYDLNWYGALDADLGGPVEEPSLWGQSPPVWGRRYAKGLVLARPLPRHDANTTDSGSVELGGLYRPVGADGTLGEPVSSITLRNAEGAVLVCVGPLPAEKPGKRRGHYK